MSYWVNISTSYLVELCQMYQSEYGSQIYDYAFNELVLRGYFE